MGLLSLQAQKGGLYHLAIAPTSARLAEKIMQEEGVSEKDFPELAPEALLEGTSILTLLQMMDTDLTRDGQITRTEAAFLIAAECSLADTTSGPRL